MNTTHVSTGFNVRALLVGLASASLGLGAAIAQAADDVPGSAPRATVVQYGDLNLANPQGTQRLYDRIVSAAEVVCGSDHHSLAAFPHFRACRERSIERAVAAVARPELTALYRAKTSQQIATPSNLVQR